MSESLQVIGFILPDYRWGKLENGLEMRELEWFTKRCVEQFGYSCRCIQICMQCCIWDLSGEGGRRIVLFWKTCIFWVLDFLSNTFSRVILDLKWRFEGLPKIFQQNESHRYCDNLIEWICLTQLSRLSNNIPMYLNASAQE